VGIRPKAGFQEPAINSKQLFAAIICTAASALFVHQIIQSGGVSATISIRAVDATTTPIRASQLHFLGPVSGKVTASESREIHLPRIPEGTYQFQMQSPGYQRREWTQKVTQKMSGTTLLVRLNPARQTSPFKPLQLQIPPNIPLQWLSDIPVNQLSRIRVRCYRLNSKVHLADPQVVSILRYIAQASPIRESLPSPRWTMVWEEYTTTTGGIRTVNYGGPQRHYRTPPIQALGGVTTAFPKEGLYIIEITAASLKGVLDPIQFPILVSPYVAFRDRNSRLHWISLNKLVPANGTLYVANPNADGLQIRRIANLNQFNHSPQSIHGGSFLIIANGSNGLTVIPNARVRPNLPTTELWIYADDAYHPTQSIIVALNRDQTQKTPRLGPAGTLTILHNAIQTPITLENGAASTSIPKVPLHHRIAVIGADQIRRLIPIRHTTQVNSHQQHHRIPTSAGGIEMSIEQSQIDVGDTLRIGLSAPSVMKVFVEFPEALGGDGLWMTLGPAPRQLTRVVLSKPGTEIGIKVSTIQNRQLKSQVLPISLAEFGESPTHGFRIDLDEVRPGTTAKLAVSHSSTTAYKVHGNCYFFVGISRRSNPIQFPSITDWVRLRSPYSSQLAIRWPIPLVGIFATPLNDGMSTPIQFAIPPNSVGDLVVYMIAQLDGVGIQGEIYRIPIRHSIDLSVSIPTNAHPNDVIKWAPAVRNNEKHPVSGRLTTFWNGIEISAHSIRIPPQSMWSEMAVMEIPATGETLQGVVKTVFTPITGNTVVVKSKLTITPYRLPRAIQENDLIAVDKDTPSHSVTQWLAKSSQTPWITSNPDLIRGLILEATPHPMRISTALCAVNYIESAYLITKTQETDWGEMFVSDLQHRIQNAKRRIHPSFGAEPGIAPEALSILSRAQSNPRTNELAYQVSHATSPHHLMDSGFGLAVLYKSSGKLYPEFLNALLARQAPNISDPEFIRGFQLVCPPHLIGQPKRSITAPTGNALSTWLILPQKDPLLYLERAQQLITLFNPVNFKYTIRSNENIVQTRRVVTTREISDLDQIPNPTIQSDSGKPFVLYRRFGSKPTVTASQNAHWRTSESTAHLVIPIPDKLRTGEATIAIPKMTGLKIIGVRSGDTIQSVASDNEWDYVTRLKSPSILVTYQILYHGFRPNTVSWAQNHRDRVYIRIPKVEL